MTSSNNRFYFIDNSKVIGIFFVIYAHTQLFHPLQNWIYSFLMPVFFFISGYLFSFKGKNNIKDFVKRRYRQLLIPYIKINAVTYIFWFFILRHVGVSNDENIPFWKPLLATLLGDGENMIHDVPLWFIVCLFIMEITYYALYKEKKIHSRILLTAAFMCIGYTSYKTLGNALPFSLGTMFTGMIFYSLGNELRRGNFQFKYIKDNNKLSAAVSTIIFIILLTATVLMSIENGRIRMYRNLYGFYPLFLLNGICGIFMVMTFCKLLETRNRLITYISRNTIWISGYHFLTFALIKGFLLYIVGFDITKLDDTVLYNLFFTMASFIMCIIGIYITDRIHYYIDNRKSNK